MNSCTLVIQATKIFRTTFLAVIVLTKLASSSQVLKVVTDTSSNITKAYSVDSLEMFLARIPEDILVDRVIPFMRIKIGVLMGASKMIRNKFLDLTVLSTYLSKIYGIPSLANVPFHPELLKLKPSRRLLSVST